MIPLLVDQNFNQQVVNGVLRRMPELDVLHVRQVGLDEAPDERILEWAAT